jgi:hypothetical protein
VRVAGSARQPISADAAGRAGYSLHLTSPTRPGLALRATCRPRQAAHAAALAPPADRAALRQEGNLRMAKHLDLLARTYDATTTWPVYMRRSAAMARRPRGEQCWDVSGPRDQPAPRSRLCSSAIESCCTRVRVSEPPSGAPTCSPDGAGPIGLRCQTFSASRPVGMDTPIVEEPQNTGNAELKPTGTIVPRPPLASPGPDTGPRRTPGRAIRCLACRAQTTKPTSMPPSQR